MAWLEKNLGDAIVSLQNGRSVAILIHDLQYLWGVTSARASQRGPWP